MLPPISNIATRRQEILLCRFSKAFVRRDSSRVSCDSSLRRESFSGFGVPFVDPFIQCYHNNISESTIQKRFVSHNNRRENTDGERGARPLYFQQSPRALPTTAYHHDRKRTQPSITTTKPLPITPYDFKGTASVLPPDARHLSPCLGAALAVCPLAGNLMRLGQRQPHGWETGSAHEKHTDAERGNTTDRCWSELLSRIGFLANNLFFQMIRESPIHMVRNKSMPANYLTPGMIGCLLGHHQTPSWDPPKNTPGNHQGGEGTGKGGKHAKDDSNDIVKEALKRDFGIKSNRICDQQWTGISMARWMDLVIPNHHESNKNHDVEIEVCQQSLVSALWLIALWGMTPSRESLFDYYEALERAGIACDPDPPQNQRGSRNDRPYAAFTEDDFAPTQLEAAMNRLLEHYGRPFRAVSETDTSGSRSDVETARAFELVCAAIVLQQQQPAVFSLPPAVPNGYFAFDGGDTKADCAEVVVREILTLLLWDDTLGRMDVSRLPATTSRDLSDFLLRLNDQQQRGIEGDEEAWKKQQEELGQTWFNMLSDLPHCDYLAKSPNGRAYELAPTSESISNALWHLLVGEEEPRGQPPLWTSLHDLANFWSKHQQHHTTLFVKHDRLNHHSGSIIVEHELLSLHLHDNSRAIELRLRCDFQKSSGMAAVTHLTKPRHERLLDPKQVEDLLELCFGKHKEKEGEAMARVRARCDPSLMMLCLALQPEHKISLPSRSEGDDESSATTSIAFESLAWLATPYGSDRRELKAIGDGSDSSDYDRKALAQSRRLLRERIFRASSLCATHPRSGAHLLSWILQESPIVVETSSSSPSSGKYQEGDDMGRPNYADIEEALLSLPASVLGNDSILEAIEWNWACFRRGRLITRAIRWKLRKLSGWQVFAQSSIHELVEVALLFRSIKGRE